MRRTLVALSVLVVLGGWAGTSSARQDAGAPPPLKASLAACGTGPSEEQRFAVFTGSMPAYRGTKRMAIRFELLTRSRAGADWETVKAKGFGRWQRSEPGRAGFVYTKRVERLAQAAEYRAVVRFRWYQSNAARPDRVRRTPICKQPDQRPNLVVETLDVLPGTDASTRRYVATVLNRGRTAARAFDIGLVAGTAVDDVRAVAGLPPGERATVEVAGPACASGEQVTAQADVRDVVEESSERDNRSLAAC